MTRSRLGLLLVLAMLTSGTAMAWVAQQRFDHWQHRDLFPSCVGCHAGATEAGASFWPIPLSDEGRLLPH